MLKQKLLARRGETLAEVLVAILVCGFSITLLAGMIMTSMNINSQTRTLDDNFYEALSDVETHAISSSDDSCHVTLTTKTMGKSNIELNVYSYTPSSGSGLTVYGEVSP